MSAENLPGPGSQPLEKCLPLFSAEILIRIYGSHQDRRISIILQLAGSHILEVYEDISGKSDVMLIIQKHGFAFEVTAAAFVKLPSLTTCIKSS